jgi:hypothetical protein
VFRIEMEVQRIVTADQTLRALVATESSKWKSCRGVSIVDLKKLMWTIVHWLQVEKTESDI